MKHESKSLPLWEWSIVIAAWAVTFAFAGYIVLTVKEAIFG